MATSRSQLKTARTSAPSKISRSTKTPASTKAATRTKSSASETRKRKKSVSTLTLPVVPTRGMVTFPFMVLPLFVGRDKSINALEAAFAGDKNILLVSQRDENIEEPVAADLFDFGTLCEIVQMMKMPDGNVRVVVEGRSRMRIIEYSKEAPYFVAQAEIVVEEKTESSPESEAITRRLRQDFETAVGLSRNIPPEAAQGAQTHDTPGALADLIISYLEVAVAERQTALENLNPIERARQVAALLTHELQVLELDKELDTHVREGVGESQREYFLRERLRAIQDKLGAGGDSSFKEADQLREKIQAAQMPEEAQTKAMSEVDRLEKMPPVAPEVSVIRTYVELMCDLPWNKKSSDVLDLKHASRVLDEDHYALEKIKDRILEFLAVRKLNPNSKGPILCFVGPPGVGKTSIGKSIARALGREFIRVSVGGIHDESEIRGHRRTYIGSMPGRIITALRRVKVNNPVFMLDEIDKLGRDFRGDPSSALLEALDPEQNNAFSDHYLEVPFDLSQVMFVATANLLDPIPAALRDRLEVLRFPGYTESEKAAIARQYLIPKQMSENGITEKDISFSDEGVEHLIQDYTREAGVRNLEREIGTVCRKIAKEVAAAQPAESSGQEAGEDGETAKSDAEKASSNGQSSTRSRKKAADRAANETHNLKLITAETLPELLGVRKFLHGTAQERDEIGVAQGLAWTEAGGELMPIEIALVAGKGGVKLTGNLGQVMKESCEAAMTYARSHATDIGSSGDWTKSFDAHIHVPAGAVPKDGPSAGVAIAVALVSALTNRAVRKDVAMTGEISLRGRALPIGGVKEKVLAAHRAGLSDVLLPRENERDLEEVPDEVKNALKFHLIDNVDEALKLALLPATKPIRKPKAATAARNGSSTRLRKMTKA
jgi:ATP-dependent Lon protease